MPPGNRRITEDDPRYDYRSSGDKRYGPGTPIPSQGGAKHIPAKRGNGPLKGGAWPKPKLASEYNLGEKRSVPGNLKNLNNAIFKRLNEGYKGSGKLGLKPGNPKDIIERRKSTGPFKSNTFTVGVGGARKRVEFKTSNENKISKLQQGRGMGYRPVPKKKS